MDDKYIQLNSCIYDCTQKQSKTYGQQSDGYLVINGHTQPSGLVSPASQTSTPSPTCSTGGSEYRSGASHEIAYLYLGCRSPTARPRLTTGVHQGAVLVLQREIGHRRRSTGQRIAKQYLCAMLKNVGLNTWVSVQVNKLITIWINKDNAWLKYSSTRG